MGRTVLNTPDDIIKDKLTSEMSWRQHAQEDYIYNKKVKIRQLKKLFRYDDITETGIKRTELERCIDNIDILKAFCEQHGIKYTVNSSSDISIETEPSSYSSKKYQYKVETVSNSIEFSISRPLMEEIVREKSDKFYRNTMDILKQKSGEWYRRFVGSDALDIVADKVMEVLNLQIESCKKWSIEHRLPYNYTHLYFGCGKEYIYYPINTLNHPRIVYKNIGLKNLENDQQAAAASAVMTERIVNRLKSDPEIAIVTARYTEAYGIALQLYMKVDIGPQDDLKSWY